VVSLTPWPLEPQERTLAPIKNEGWVGSRARLDMLDKIKSLVPARDRNPNCPVTA